MQFSLVSDNVENLFYFLHNEKPITDGSAQNKNLFHFLSVVVESQVPGSSVHVLYEAHLLEGGQDQVPGRGVGILRHRLNLLSDQLFPVQELDKVKLQEKKKKIRLKMRQRFGSQKLGHHKLLVGCTDMPLLTGCIRVPPTSQLGYLSLGTGQNMKSSCAVSYPVIHLKIT